MATIRQRERKSCELQYSNLHTRERPHPWYRVGAAINEIVTLYDPDTPHWSSIEELDGALNFTNLVSRTGAKYLQSHGVSHRFVYELLEAATRVNYAQVGRAICLLWFLGLTTSATQNIDQIHTLETFVSLAADEAASVKGGNWQIFEGFVKRSGAQLFLKTEVGRLLHLSLANP